MFMLRYHLIVKYVLENKFFNKDLLRDYRAVIGRQQNNQTIRGLSLAGELTGLHDNI